MKEEGRGTGGHFLCGFSNGRMAAASRSASACVRPLRLTFRRRRRSTCKPPALPSVLPTFLQSHSGAGKERVRCPVWTSDFRDGLAREVLEQLLMPWS